MRQSHLIISNAAVMWIMRILQLLPQVILVPYLISTIGETGYGIYALVWSLTMSINLLQLSLQSGVVKYSAGYLAQGRIDEVNKVVSSSFVYSLVLAVVACVGTLIASIFYKDPSGQMGSALVVVAFMLLLTVPLTPYVAIIQSRQHYYVGAVALTASRYLSLGLVIAWFKLIGPGVGPLIVIMAIMQFLSLSFQIPVAHYLVRGLRNRPRLFDRKIFALISSFGAATVFIALSNALNSTGVRWLMGALASTAFVAHLAIILMPGILLAQAISSMTITIMPATSAYEATGNKKMLQELLIRGMRYTCILVMVGIIVASLLLRDVLTLWVGRDYVFLSQYTFILLATQSFMLTASTAHHMLKGLAKIRGLLLTYVFGYVVIPAIVVLAVFRLYENPYVAATAGLAVGHLICGCAQVALVGKVLGLTMGSMISRVYIQPIASAMIAVLPAFVLQWLFAFKSIFSHLALAALVLSAFAYVMYTLFATAEERKDFFSVYRFGLNKAIVYTRMLRKTISAIV